MALSAKARYFLKSAMGSPAYSKEVADAIDAAATIETAEIAANAVTFAKIASNAVGLRHMQPDSVNVGAMAANSVDSDQLVDGCIDTEHFAAGSVNVAAMASDSVDSDQYVDGSIDKVHLSAGIQPSHMVVYAGEVVVTEQNQQNTVSGALDTDLVFIQSANAHPNVSNSTAEVTADTITINCAADPGAVDALVKYQIIRATS